MLTAHVIDHSERIKEKIRDKVAAACVAAAEVLAEKYRQELQASQSPPHSRPGEIPHAYLGHREGGWGPRFERGQPNNTPQSGFDSTQIGSLAIYIEAGTSGTGAVVGFEPSHVGNRSQNYLIEWDQGRVRGGRGRRRPWIRPIFDESKQRMKEAAIAAMKADLPF